MKAIMEHYHRAAPPQPLPDPSAVRPPTQSLRLDYRHDQHCEVLLNLNTFGEHVALCCRTERLNTHTGGGKDEFLYVEDDEHVDSFQAHALSGGTMGVYTTCEAFVCSSHVLVFHFCHR